MINEVAKHFFGGGLEHKSQPHEEMANWVREEEEHLTQETVAEEIEDRRWTIWPDNGKEGKAVTDEHSGRQHESCMLHYSS